MYKRTLIIWVLCMLGHHVMYGWTYRYNGVFSDQQRHANAHKSEMVCASFTPRPFTQVIFSWNALRPAKGYYSFWIQVRSRDTQRWDTYKKMIEWGHDRQASFLHAEDDLFAQYHHVRLELGNTPTANAVRIKIKAHGGADLSNVHLISITTSDYTRFCAEDSRVLAQQLSTVRVHNVPAYSQMALEHEKKEALCSVTSMSMLINYLHPSCRVLPTAFADMAYDKGLCAYGSWPFNIAAAFDQCKGQTYFFVTRARSFMEIYQQLCKRMPVIVSVRGQLRGGAKEYQHGHLLVVIGYDARHKKVLCHDPAFATDDRVAMAYDLDTFLQGWERSRRLMYCASPKNKAIRI